LTSRAQVHSAAHVIGLARKGDLPMRTAVAVLLPAVLALTGVLAALAADAPPSNDKLNLKLRSRGPAADAAPVEKAEAWDPKRTAIIVCDMWDDHWCKSAAARVGELAPVMNEMLKTARGKGVFVIHAPSSVTAFYKDTPARKLAQSAPFAPTPIALSTVQRWGTAWLYPDKSRGEPEMPVDDADMGCDCAKKCEIREAWKRQNAAIEIVDGDALTDDGQETWNLLQQRKIDNVILCGVHLNMCVLGRPFAIRQMVKLGKHVALMRDMTDTMYDPRNPPKVSHFDGTDLVVAHVERHWCPSFMSTDITGAAKPFRFKDDPRGK
jgi:nicotinamidase-related amidase